MSKKISPVVTPALCVIILSLISPLITPMEGELGITHTVFTSVMSSFVVGLSVIVFEHSLGGICNSLEP